MTEQYSYEPDEIGAWSEQKIRIVSKYAQAYSTILSNQPRLKHYYVDGFTGGGIALRKVTKEPVETTAKRILALEPPFVGYHLIDADPAKAAAMKLACAQRSGAVAHCGDANELLPPIFGTIRYDQYKRGLCFLDPYKIMLSWNVLVAAAKTKAMEIFLHFPTGDIQRNVLRRDQSSVDADAVARMNAMWGDDSWRSAAYAEVPNLFGTHFEKQPIDSLLTAFTERLQKVAGFKFVAKPQPMRNKTNAIIYHLIFATQNPTGLRIANQILQFETTLRGRGYGNQLD